MIRISPDRNEAICHNVVLFGSLVSSSTLFGDTILSLVVVVPAICNSESTLGKRLLMFRCPMEHKGSSQHRYPFSSIPLVGRFSIFLFCKRKKSESDLLWLGPFRMICSYKHYYTSYVSLHWHIPSILNTMELSRAEMVITGSF